MKEILWQPDKERVERSRRCFDFCRPLTENSLRISPPTAELHQWSVQHIETFWDFYRRYSGLRFSRPPDETLSSLSMPGTRWFSGAELNYAENLLTAPLQKKPPFSVK